MRKCLEMEKSSEAKKENSDSNRKTREEKAIIFYQDAQINNQRLIF